MDNQTLQNKFRHQLTNGHALTVITVSLFEIIGYIILINSGVENFAINNLYLWYGVVFPIVINCIAHLVARRIVNSKRVSTRSKNKSIIAAALITSFVVAVIHKEYIVTSCAFIFPMILSAMFNDKKLLNASFFISVVILGCVGLAFWLDKNITITTAMNLFILFGFALISYLCSYISINFSGQSYTTIKSQAEQNSKLKDDVMKDQMTGLYNHSVFIKQLDSLIGSISNEEKLCLAMIDVDDFKHINDTYGHDCGDLVLIQIAKTLQKHCSATDTAYRYGGEEFAIIFRGKSADNVCAITEKILADVSSYDFPFTNKKITFSAGVAQHRSGTRDELFESADQTLYVAKKSGKNRVIQADT